MICQVKIANFLCIYIYIYKKSQGNSRHWFNRITFVSNMFSSSRRWKFSFDETCEIIFLYFLGALISSSSVKLD